MSTDFAFDDVERGTTINHLKLLCEERLLKGIVVQELVSGDVVIQTGGHVRLSWEGHEFLDAARDPSRWAKAIKKSKEAAGTLSFEVLKQLLAQLMRESVGLIHI